MHFAAFLSDKRMIILIVNEIKNLSIITSDGDKILDFDWLQIDLSFNNEFIYIIKKIMVLKYNVWLM